MDSSTQLHHRILAWSWMGILVTLLPHLFHIPVVLSAGCMVVMMYGLWSLLLRRRPWFPKMWVKIILMIVSLVVIIKNSGATFSSEPATAFLVVLAILKVLEMRRTRDVHVVVLLCFFLLAAQFFYAQSLLYTLYAVAVTPWLVAVLMISFRPEGSWKKYWLEAGIVIGQALPLAIVVFLLIPRFSHPLWSIPSQSETATTGLGLSMTPGSISRLIPSDRVVLRATFQTLPPKPAEMYWRGPVLWRLTGETWRALDVPLPGSPAPFAVRSKRWVQEITLEPGSLPLLFALDYPDQAPDGARLNRDRQIVVAKPVSSVRRYTVVSHAATQDFGAPLEHEQRLALALPATGNPRARQLAADWRSRDSQPWEIVQLGLDYFAIEPFTYTLMPPSLGRDAIDGFLFDTRQGFCEHFAGAFTFLMRAAGVMARVVTGYQGGTFNPLGNHVTVRDADAHAWVEVWLPGHGWVRVDPTAVVAPVRVEQGMEAVAAREPDAFPVSDHSGLLWRPLRQLWDWVEYDWNRLVIGFDSSKQHKFWSALGWPHPESWELIVTLVLAIALFPFFWALFARIMPAFRVQRDPFQHLYGRFCRKLAKAGVPRHPWEGPLRYGERAAILLPKDARDIVLIAKICSQWRYEHPLASDKRAHLKSKILGFNPGNHG
ncbi:MAG: DUF3488 domain-containing transglutaminase family protein [Magnetococcales bacterium]|nr:DUF3488 domain-containing transglutaminase family protein [Magnetococcales bacterium]